MRSIFQIMVCDWLLGKVKGTIKYVEPYSTQLNNEFGTTLVIYWSHLQVDDNGVALSLITIEESGDIDGGAYTYFQPGTHERPAR